MYSVKEASNRDYCFFLKFIPPDSYIIEAPVFSYMEVFLE